MDDYTLKTKDWLNERFTQTTNDGIYFAHQPIYGFRHGHSEDYFVSRYMITYHIMRMLSHLHFETLLDVGGAEGYKAALARELFKIKSKSSDLSDQASMRAKEIFNIDSDVIDIQNLPYRDNEFDVVVCSETLEHIPDIISATNELIRIASKAVIITVPHEPESEIKKNIENNIPHAHLHALDESSFNFATLLLKGIHVKKILSPFLNIPSAIVEARKRESVASYGALSTSIFNLSLPLFHVIFGKRTAGILLHLDEILPQITNKYSGMIFLLIKDAAVFTPKPLKKITPLSIINFEVPYYYLHNS